MSCKVGRRLRHTADVEVTGRCDYDEDLVTDVPRDQGRIAQMADPNEGIEPSPMRSTWRSAKPTSSAIL